MKLTFVLGPGEARGDVLEAILRAPEGYAVTIAPESRSGAQNRLLHPLLDDIAHQTRWDGRPLPMLQWKTLMVSGHAIATGEDCKLVRGIEGELVNLRESTAAMTKSRFASLVEYVLAWGTNQGVWFRTDPRL